MHIKHKAPIGIPGIAKIMNMHEAEVREWPYLQDMREAMRDYNLGVLSTEKLIQKLNDISIKCNEAQLHHYSTGIESAVSAIKLGC